MACRLPGREGTPQVEPGRSCRKLSHVGPAFAFLWSGFLIPLSDPRKHCSLHYKSSPRLYPNCRQGQVRSESSNDVPVLISERDCVLGGGGPLREGKLWA